MTERSHLSLPVTSPKQSMDRQGSSLSRGSISRSQTHTSTFDESSSMDMEPESPTLPPDMARDEGFDISNNLDDLRLDQAAAAAAPPPPRSTKKPSIRRDLEMQPTMSQNGNTSTTSLPVVVGYPPGYDRHRSSSHSTSSSSKRRPSHANLRHTASSSALHQQQREQGMSSSSSSSQQPAATSSASHPHGNSHRSHHSRRHHHLSDHMAAAIELTTSPNVPPAPAAGMYWSRAISFGRGPSRPLRAHTSNLIGEHLYVFGGCDFKTCFNTLYILDMDTLTWSKPRTLGELPPPCRAHSCTTVEHDMGNGRRVPFLYLFGGGDGPNYFNELYVLNTETLTWSKPTVDGLPPSPRRAHTTCLWNKKIIVVGGGDGAQALADVHCLDIADPSRPVWSQLGPTGTPPIARGYHTSNLVKDKLIVYGGSDGHECFSNVYILDLVNSKWTQVDLDLQKARLAHTATQVGSYIFVVGGHDGNRYSNDVLMLNLVTMSWETRKIYGGAPSPRGYHTAVLHDSRLYILGGYDGKNVFEDIYLLELSACAYLPQITNFEIDV